MSYEITSGQDLGIRPSGHVMDDHLTIYIRSMPFGIRVCITFDKTTSNIGETMVRFG